MVRVRTVDGRKFTDPDVVALIEQCGGRDPYFIVRERATELLQKLSCFEGQFDNPLQRMCILASVAGFGVEPMVVTRKRKEDRDAVLMPTGGDGKRGTIFFDPTKPDPRVVFSIGHEITHSFFPTSGAGARFRTLCGEGSKSARELEMLCHFGASELTMPLLDFKASVNRFGFGVRSVDSIREPFGTSFEACLYRVAITASFPAAAGRFRFRLKVGEREDENADVNLAPDLFGRKEQPKSRPIKKYRRHSFYYSESFPSDLVIPWNKSVPGRSCVYRAAKSGSIETGVETIPVDGRGRALTCSLEALPTLFQADGTDPEWPDILFLLRICP